MAFLSSLSFYAAGGSLGTLYVRLAANSIDLVKGMVQAEVAVERSSAAMLKHTKALALGMTGAFTTISSVGVYEFAKFEHEMTKSTAIMGELSFAMRKELEATAREVARNSTTAATKLAESYFFLASAGLSARQSVAALDTVNTFAIAGQFDMALATDLLTDAQSALGLTIRDDVNKNMENMARLSDVLVKANNLANATVQQFSESLTREAGAALKSFNVDVEEGVAVLATFADQGVKGELAGRSLSRILRLMTTAAVANAEAYQMLGIRVFDSTGNLRNLADIVEDVTNSLKPMSDEQRVAALETLGFQARIQGVILPLLGTADAIRGYERSLRDAAGTTEEVAHKQMSSFTSQLTITWNRIKDIVLTIGEALIPIFKILNKSLQESTDAQGSFASNIERFYKIVAPGLITAIGMVGDAFWGWKVIIKTGEVALLGMAQLTAKVFSSLVTGISSLLETVVGNIFSGINKAIEGVNRFISALPDWMKPESIERGMFAKFDFKLDIDTHRLELLPKVMEDATKLAIDELKALAAETKPSEDLLERYSQALKGIGAEQKSLVDSSKKTVQDLSAEVQAAIEGISETTVEGIKYTTKSATDIINAMSIPNLRSFAGLNDILTSTALRLQQEKDSANENLQILRDIENQKVMLTKQANEQRLKLVTAYTAKLKQLHEAEMLLVVQSARNISESLLSIAENTAGAQSGIYRGMFAVSKAFAIAEASVKIAQGAAAALGEGATLAQRLAGMASVLAAGASIVADIRSIQFAYDERASGGPVKAGRMYMVGERGRELFVPDRDGTIVPNNALGGLRIEVHNYTGAHVSFEERVEEGERVIVETIKRTRNQLAAEIREGSGEFTRSVESTYNLRRGNR